MTVASYSIALGAMLLMVVPLSWASIGLRRRFFADWSGPLAWLVGLVMVLELWLMIAEVLGSFGTFTRPVLVVTCAFVGTVLGMWTRRQRNVQPSKPATPEGSQEGPWERGVRALLTGSLVGVGVVWMLRAGVSFFGGIASSWDSVWYHLPFAARFVQTGSLTLLHDVANPPSTFLPANGEVFHAIGLLIFGNDVLSPVLNLLWLAILLSAAWCAGIPAKRPHLTALVGALIAAWPIFQNTQPGTANTDIAGLALVVTAVALLLNAGVRFAPAVLAAASLGFAAGTKLSLLPVVVALAPMLFVTVSPMRRFVLASGVGILTGSFWYLRNLVRAGNPFPWIGVSLGPIQLPHVASDPVDCGTATVARYLTQPEIWTQWFLPGLRAGLGPLWWALLVGAICGGGLALVRGPRAPVRALGGAALLGAVFYAITPASGGGLPGTLHCFAFNLRFLVPALFLGLLAGCLAISRRLSPYLFLSIAVVLLVTLPGTRRAGVVGSIIAASVVTVLFVLDTLAPSSKLTRLGHRRAHLAMAAVLLAALIGFPITNRYLERRYANSQFDEPVGLVARWARDVRGARIGVAGFAMTYPLYGLHGIDNDVDYVRLDSSKMAFLRPTTCDSWRAALHENGYTHVVVGVWITGEPPPREAEWTRGNRSAREILRDGPTSVFALDPATPPSPCSADDSAG